MDAFHSFYQKIDAQVRKAKACTGFAAFVKDVETLKITNTSFGLPAITANVWLHKICELSDEELIAYVEKYQKGWLNAWEAHEAFVGRRPKEPKGEISHEE